MKIRSKEMKEINLKASISILFICTHIIAPIILFIGYLNNKFKSFDDFMSIMGIIIPLTAGNTTIIVSWIISQKDNIKKSKKKVNLLYGIISYIFIVSFIICYLGVIICKIFDIFYYIEFEIFKYILISIETVFAAYIGRIIISLFNIKEEKTITEVKKT